MNPNKFGAGDCYIIEQAITESVPGKFFVLLKQEVNWQPMHNRGNPVPRLVAVQGELDHEGVQPLYRHPADEEPTLSSWTTTVDLLRKRAETLLSMSLNHALIQFYEDGNHWIGRHSDKTLDITKGTDICNFSFGATRVMLLRNKIADKKGHYHFEKIQLPNTSLFVLGWNTNRRYHHQINKDRRHARLKQPDELAFDGSRISITLRSVSTFMLPDRRIYGQGAICKRRAELRNFEPMDKVGREEEAAMLTAFGAENRDPEFDWEQHYHQGFNAINFKILNAK